jgi:DNA replication protein DnaD
MPRMIYDYTKSVLERVSFDPLLFMKELKKAIKNLLPYEIEQLSKWLKYFTNEKPELHNCLLIINTN